MFILYFCENHDLLPFEQKILKVQLMRIPTFLSAAAYFTLYSQQLFSADDAKHI